MDLELVREVGLGEALLADGRYEEGFRRYEAWRRLYTEKWMDLPLQPWTGEDLSGKRLLIAGEQGFGDQIMFARFAKMLQRDGVEVFWLCAPPMARLLNTCLGIPAETPEAGIDVAHDTFYCPSSRLPNLFFPPLSSPPDAPYLTPPPANTISGLRVGVVTRGNPKHVNDARRSIPDALAATLLDLPAAVSLAPEDTGARDFYDTATIVAGLDLVISVDTAVVHLAGAMGKPVWVLLPHDADWRWMKVRDDSPWYRSARLFRQDAPGDWLSLLEKVQAAYSSQAATLAG